jgi:hypothetical protein
MEKSQPVTTWLNLQHLKSSQQCSNSNVNNSKDNRVGILNSISANRPILSEKSRNAISSISCIPAIYCDEISIKSILKDCINHLDKVDYYGSLDSIDNLPSNLGFLQILAGSPYILGCKSKSSNHGLKYSNNPSNITIPIQIWRNSQGNENLLDFEDLSTQ